MRSSGQAALEFLITYGWAFLVMIAVIGGIVALDPLDSTPSVGMCKTESTLSCDEARTTIDEEHDTVTVRLENEDDEAITISDVRLSSVNGRNTSSRCRSPGVVRSGDVAAILCYNVSLDTEDTANILMEYDVFQTKVGSAYARTESVGIRGGADMTSPGMEGLLYHGGLDGNTLDSQDNTDGTVYDGNFTEGVIGQALRTDSDTYVDTEVQPNLTGSLDRTISLWFRRESDDDPMWIYGQRYSGQNYELGIRNNDVGFFLTGDETWNDVIHAGTDPLKNRWYHVAIAIGENELRIYLDGRLKNTKSQSVSSVSLNTTNGVGRRLGDSSPAPFKGRVDEVRVYNNALNEQQIKNLYELTKPE